MGQAPAACLRLLGFPCASQLVSRASGGLKCRLPEHRPITLTAIAQQGSQALGGQLHAIETAVAGQAPWREGAPALDTGAVAKRAGRPGGTDEEGYCRLQAAALTLQLASSTNVSQPPIHW